MSGSIALVLLLGVVGQLSESATSHPGATALEDIRKYGTNLLGIELDQFTESRVQSILADADSIGESVTVKLVAA